VDRDMVAREVLILRTACGRAYLAYCSEAEQREIIQYLKTLNDPNDKPYIADDSIQEVLTLARRQGYARRHNEPYVPTTSSIALPLLVDGIARGSLAVVWLTSAMPSGRAIKQFVAPLREAANAIVQRLAGTPQLWALPSGLRPASRTSRRR
jgi:IclR family transcriptional regulator, mhp operon transcriptional activator